MYVCAQCEDRLKMLIHAYAVCVAAVLATAVRVNGEESIVVNWTVDGVQNYGEPSTPLRTQLGDTLILKCENRSNVFIQNEFVQFDTCNASAGSGKFRYNGYCNSALGLNEVRLTLTLNSQDLVNTVNFMNNRHFYLTSYYNGIPSDIDEASIHTGGQCEEGLKLILAIGDVAIGHVTDPVSPVSPVSGTGSGLKSGGNKSSSTFKFLYFFMITFIYFVNPILS